MKQFNVELATYTSFEAETTINVFGIKLFIFIQCKFEAGESETINSDNFTFTVCEDHAVKVGGAWHEAICDVVQDKIIDRIYLNMNGVA